MYTMTKQSDEYAKVFSIHLFAMPAFRYISRCFNLIKATPTEVEQRGKHRMKRVIILQLDVKACTKGNQHFYC